MPITTKIAARTPVPDILEHCEGKLRELHYPFYISDLAVFFTLIDIFYEWDMPVSEASRFFSLRGLYETYSRPRLTIIHRQALERGFERLTHHHLSNDVIRSPVVEERYNHALSIFLL